MTQRLSELCRGLLCQTSDAEKLFMFPLPSTAERIPVTSSPRNIPFALADQLIEDLAKLCYLIS